MIEFLRFAVHYFPVQATAAVLCVIAGFFCLEKADTPIHLNQHIDDWAKDEEEQRQHERLWNVLGGLCFAAFLAVIYFWFGY